MMRTNFRIMVLYAVFLVCACSKTPRESGLYDYTFFRDGFMHPPVSAQPKVYWWWLDGNTDTLRLKEELIAIKNAGIGGVDIFEIGVPSFRDQDQSLQVNPLLR